MSIMQQNQTDKNQYSRRLKRLMPLGVFILAMSIFLVAFAKTTDGGGLFSFSGTWVSGKQVSAMTKSFPAGAGVNSQNILLPSYPANLILLAYAGTSSTTVPIDDDTVLSPDMAAASDFSNIEPPNTSISTYVVQSDDTLSGIAVMFDISMDTIKQANHLPGNTLKPGQSLVILPVTGVLYTAVSGDSLAKIAKKYSVNSDDIVTYNDLSSASAALTVGQQLVIPHGKPSASDVTTFLSKQKYKVPSFEPLLDPVWNWPSYPGYFTCPVPGARLSQGLHGHNAVDLAISVGTPIRATASGIVIVSKSNGLWNGGYGNFVMISHPNGVESLYAHMSRTAVSPGQAVSQGQTIGYIGMTGMTTGPHTHFEIRGAVNPFVDPALCR